MAIVHYQLDDGVGANVKITPHLLFREGFKVAGDDLLLDIIQRCVLPSLQTALQRAGVTDAAALLATLFGDSGRIDTQAILRQQTALQLFMPLGHAVLSAWEQSDIKRSVCRFTCDIWRSADPPPNEQRDELYPAGDRSCLTVWFADI